MELITSWLLLPIALIAVLMGCGLLARALAGASIRPALLPGVGLAVLICAGHLTTAFDSAAEITTPVVIALALAGYLAAWPFDWRAGAREVWPGLAAGMGVFLAYSAPIVLSGEATFAGFIKLDDTATWMALTDRVMEHGHSLDGLAPSTYEATLAFNLGDGYPIGAFLPLGVASELVGTDPAWVIQPYMSLLAGILAAVMTELGRPLVRSAWLRAAAAFVSAQSALLVGYVLWGGIKEIEAAALIALAAALTPPLFERESRPASAAPLALTAAALLAVLSLGGASWLLPVLLVPLVVLWRRSTVLAWQSLLVFSAISLVILLPLVAGGELLPPNPSLLTSASEKGNLIEPLSVFQVFGVWPVGDFRLHPEQELSTAIAIAVAAATAIAGVVAAWRRGATAVLLYWAAVALGAVFLIVVGSPWVEGKALATASPGIALAATLGIAVLFERGLRIEAGLAALIVAGGILYSNVLGYRDVFLAPRPPLAELERIGEEIEGEGPALMTEYNPYGARHFLREADAEGASELRRREVPLRDGNPLGTGVWADTDSFHLGALLIYRTLVLRRSPAQSRPPLPYSLVNSGRYYDVWQRPPSGIPGGLEMLPLGDAADPSAEAQCAAVRELAGRTPLATIAYAERTPNVVVDARDMQHPGAWSNGAAPTLLPRDEGTASTEVELPVAGPWTVWLGGSVRGRMEAAVDGRPVGSVRHLLNNEGLYIELGTSELDAGLHTVELRYSGTDAHPGSGGRPFPIGPLVLERMSAPEERVGAIPAARAGELCGKRLDWVQVVPGRIVTAARSSR
jgi:hypothetical protein